MGRVFQPLLFLLPFCTRNDLIRQIEFLKAENEMLRARVPKKLIFLNADERSRLLKLGKAIGPGLKHLLTIVSYTTYLAWVRKAREGYQPKKVGRPKTKDAMRELIVKIASETGWGYTRVMGELKKLGIKPPSRTTVKKILKEHTLEVGPPDGQGTWDDFLKRHAETLWQCDFFSKRIWTKFGLRQCFVLIFLHVSSRRVFVTQCTQKPTVAWMTEQAEKFVQHARSTGHETVLLRRDRDTNYRREFDDVLRGAGMQVKKNCFRSPNLQAHFERFIQSLQQEALDHFIVFGERHFDYLVTEYVEHYHTERPHQSLGNTPLTGGWPTSDGDMPDPDKVACRTRLGGLLKHYERVAA
ncbi:MAG: integrase core domain-containing protein [Planctomycetaceae bacterium]